MAFQDKLKRHPYTAPGHLLMLLRRAAGERTREVDSLMGVYDRFVVPRLLALAMRNRELVPYRERVVGAAEGRVLEIGIGSGLNLPFYRTGVTEVIGVDPSETLLAMAEARRARASIPVRLECRAADELLMENASVDTVVTTWTLCSIADPVVALQEVRRVLRPGGRLLFVEHGRAPDADVRVWQDRLTPVWKRLAGGCHLNRKIDEIVKASGFETERMRVGYLGRPRFATFMYEGAAKARA